MAKDMGLPGGPVHLSLIGFRPDGFAPGVKIEILLSAEAFAQLLEHGATGAVENSNLVLTEQGAEVRDSSGQLNIKEVMVSRIE
jgi:hypothetical protein